MKLFIICSKAFYEKIPPITAKLEKIGAKGFQNEV